MSKQRGLLRLLSFVLAFSLTAGSIGFVSADAASGTIISITQQGQVVDTFNGVSSLYQPGSWDGTDPTYSCAAYVIRYYSTVYGKTVYNLFHAQTPMTTDTDSFVAVSDPQPGDICAQVKTSTNHWSIVKSVNAAAQTVTVIDQNNKWSYGNVTQAYKDFTYGYGEVTFYRLASVNSGTAAPQAVGTTTAPSADAATTAATVSAEASSNAGYVPASKIKLKYKSIWLPKKTKFKFKTTVKLKPANNTDQVTFKSSNKKIATITKNTGKIRTKRKGHCKITIKTASGKKKKCTVYVY